MKISKMHYRVMYNGITRPHVSAIPETKLMPDKGKRLGSCNRTACQGPGAFWYNRNMRSWYCTDCAHALNQVPLESGEYLCILDEDAMNEYSGVHADFYKRSALALSKRYQ